MDRELDIATRDGKHPDERILVLKGVLIAETTSQFYVAARQYRAGPLLLDMTAVRYIDSSGLGALISTYVSLEKAFRPLMLAGLNDRIWDLFRICKITDVFTRYPTLADAETALRDATLAPEQ